MHERSIAMTIVDMALEKAVSSKFGEGMNESLKFLTQPQKGRKDAPKTTAEPEVK